MKELSVAVTAVVMSDHILKKLYNYVQSRGEGYIFTVDTVGQWAVKFEKKYKNVDWEDVQLNPTKYGFSKNCFSWDDAVMEYADKRFKKFKEEGR